MYRIFLLKVNLKGASSKDKYNFLISRKLLGLFRYCLKIEAVIPSVDNLHNKDYDSLSKNHSRG